SLRRETSFRIRLVALRTLNQAWIRVRVSRNSAAKRNDKPGCKSHEQQSLDGRVKPAGRCQRGSAINLVTWIPEPGEKLGIVQSHILLLMSVQMRHRTTKFVDPTRRQ